MRLTTAWLRIATVTVGALLLLFALVVWAVVLKRDALMRRALKVLSAKTGAVIGLRSFDLGFATSGIELSAGDASIAYQGQSVQAKRIDVLIGYSQLVRARLLPLKSVTVTGADVSLAPGSNSAHRTFDLQGYVDKLPKLAATVVRFVNHLTIAGGELRLTSLKASDGSVPSVALDVSLDAGPKILRVAVQRVFWNGPPIDGFSASATFTLPTREGRHAKPAHGDVEFIRRSNVALNGQLQLAVEESAALRGHLRVHAQPVPTLGQVGFDGSYTLSTAQLELTGTMLIPAELGLGEHVPIRVSVSEQFSSNPQLSLGMGPFRVLVEQASRALGVALAIAPRGTLDVQRLQFSTAVAPWREAFSGCSSAACKEREMLNALIGRSSAELVIAGADLAAEGTPLVAELRRLGFLNMQLKNPLRLTLDGGVAAADGLGARIGALEITHGQFRLDAQQAVGSSAVHMVYRGGFFWALDLSQPALQEVLPASVRTIVRPQRIAYAQATFGGALADDNNHFKAENPWFELRRGFLEFADDRAHSALAFSGRAELKRRLLLSSARVSILGTSALSADTRFDLPSRTLRAQIKLRGANVWRWYRTFVQDSSLSKFKVSGRADGRLTVLWQASRQAPRLTGALAVENLLVDSSYTKKPVLVRKIRVLFNQQSAELFASPVMLGAGHFDLQAAVSDFTNPVVNLTVSGSRFDADAINFDSAKTIKRERSTSSAQPGPTLRSQLKRAAAPGSHSSEGDAASKPSAMLAGAGISSGDKAASARASYSLVLSGRVNLRAVFFRGIRIDDVAAQVEGQGNQWKLKSFSARAFKGSATSAAVWDGDRRQLYFTGNASQIDARALFVALGATDKQPVSGTLNAKINAGLSLPGAGRPPTLLCGGASIVVLNGALGKADVLVRIMELLSVQSWLTFSPPDLDQVGLPFDKILVRLTFAPRAITVQELQLSGTVVRLVGHGEIYMPEERLDLHLAAMPFTSPRWALDKVPVVGNKLGHSFDRVFAVRIAVSGPADASEVSPELFGSIIDALLGVVELPLDFIPENALPEALLQVTPTVQDAFNKCAPPP
jgi:hypothetical protein